MAGRAESGTRATHGVRLARRDVAGRGRASGSAAADAPLVRLAAVGTATARVLADAAGRPVDVVPATQRSQSLLDELCAVAEPGQRFLVAQGDRADDTLVAGLRRAGHHGDPGGGVPHRAASARSHARSTARTPCCSPAARPQRPGSRHSVPLYRRSWSPSVRRRLPWPDDWASR